MPLKNLKTNKLPEIWAFHSTDGLGWFRILGVGLFWKDTSKHPLLFGERNGYTKGLKIGSWFIKIQKK